MLEGIAICAGVPDLADHLHICSACLKSVKSANPEAELHGAHKAGSTLMYSLQQLVLTP